MVPDDIANLVGEELCACTQFLCLCEGRGGERREECALRKKDGE